MSIDYFDRPEMNQSKLKYILKSEADFKMRLEEHFKQTDEMRLGSAVHLLVLQPHLSHKIMIAPAINGNTRLGKIWDYLLEGKQLDFFYVFDKERAPKGKKTPPKFVDKYVITPEEYEELLELKDKYAPIINRSPDVIILTQTQFDTAHKMVASIKNNTDAMTLINSCKAFEKAYFWKYNEIDMKGQVDGEGDFGDENQSFILDLKSTSQFDKSKLKFVIDNMDYDFQAAYYLKGAMNKKYYFIIFINSQKPYLVYPFQLSAQTIQRGFDKLEKACNLYNNCLKFNPEFITDNKLELI